MGEIKVEKLTPDEIRKMQAEAAGNFQGEVPVYRVEETVPEQLRFTAEVEGGFIAAFADVWEAIEVANITYYFPHKPLGAPEQLPKVKTAWEFMCQVPDLLGKVVVGGLYIGKTIRLPVNGVMLKFRVAKQYPKS